jgi:hypothetical protein
MVELRVYIIKQILCLNFCTQPLLHDSCTASIHNNLFSNPRLSNTLVDRAQTVSGRLNCIYLL